MKREDYEKAATIMGDLTTMERLIEHLKKAVIDGETGCVTVNGSVNLLSPATIKKLVPELEIIKGKIEDDLKNI